MDTASKNSAHHSFWRTSDFFLIVTVATSLVLEYLWPIPLPFDARLAAIIGGTMTCTGLLFIVLARLAFRTAQQPTAPGIPTTRVVDAGIFRVSRNPIYLGLVLAVAGTGLLLGNVWLVILDIPLALLLHGLFVIPEEAYLLKTFGDDYRAYMQQVRRWL